MTFYTVRYQRSAGNPILGVKYNILLFLTFMYVKM